MFRIDWQMKGSWWKFADAATFVFSIRKHVVVAKKKCFLVGQHRIWRNYFTLDEMKSFCPPNKVSKGGPRFCSSKKAVQEWDFSVTLFVKTWTFGWMGNLLENRYRFEGHSFANWGRDFLFTFTNKHLFKLQKKSSWNSTT